MVKKDNEDSSKDKDALREHDIASKVVGDSGIGNATLLVGYIGKTDNDNSVRLYFDLNFDEFVDIPRESILHAANAPEDVLPFGGTYLWVKKDEHITHVRVESTKQQAKFFQGNISPGLVTLPEPMASATDMLRPSRGCGSKDVCVFPSDDAPCGRSFDRPCGRSVGRRCDPPTSDAPCGGFSKTLPGGCAPSSAFAGCSSIETCGHSREFRRCGR